MLLRSFIFFIYRLKDTDSFNAVWEEYLLLAAVILIIIITLLVGKKSL